MEDLPSLYPEWDENLGEGYRDPWAISWLGGVQSAALAFEARWSEAASRPVVTAYSIGLDGEEFGRIGRRTTEGRWGLRGSTSDTACSTRGRI